MYTFMATLLILMNDLPVYAETRNARELWAVVLHNEHEETKGALSQTYNLKFSVNTHQQLKCG